jgi:hypothetical protein
MAQNAIGGRAGGKPCCGTFVITDSEGEVVYYGGGSTSLPGGTGGINGTHAESLEAQAAVAWLRANAQRGQTYNVNFVNQYGPCTNKGCNADYQAGNFDQMLDDAADTNGASASATFWVERANGEVYMVPRVVPPLIPAEEDDLP